MINVESSASSLRRGDLWRVTVHSELGRSYRNVQLDVMQVGLANPRECWSGGIGTNGNESVVFEVPTANTEVGFYEVVSVRFHDDDAGLPQQVFLGGRDYPRAVAHVRLTGEAISIEAVVGALHVAERALDQSFMAGLVLPNGTTAFECFVFAVGVRLTRRIRFEHWAVVPAAGLPSSVHEWVTEFFRTAMSGHGAFEFNPALDRQIRDANPGCVACFPRVVALDEKVALDYATREFQRILETLALVRGGFGKVVCAAIGRCGRDDIRLHVAADQYRGNLIGGALAGEDPHQIVQAANRLRSASFRYLVSLYAEALRELNPNFAYVRYWQILETAAERRNFDPRTPLLDFSGQPIVDKAGKPRTVRNAAPIVYELLKADFRNPDGSLDPNAGTMQIGSQEGSITVSLWERVQVWLAFRNATAHFGGFRIGDALQMERLHDYDLCAQAWADMSHAGHDFFADDLKATVSRHMKRALAENYDT
jgi:hypothetical protein